MKHHRISLLSLLIDGARADKLRIIYLERRIQALQDIAETRQKLIVAQRETIQDRDISLSILADTIKRHAINKLEEKTK